MVQEIQKEPFYYKNTHCPENRFYGSQIVNESMNENTGDNPEIKKPCSYIDSDGVHSDHHKRESPFFVSPDIDNPEKNCEQEEAPPAGKEYIRAGPDELVNGEGDAPD